MVTPYESLITLMCTIPGIDRNSAITVIFEIGNDVSLFCSSKRLFSWAGLAPGSNESAGKKKSVRISCAGVYLKPTLVEIAHCAVKSTKSPYYKNKYERLAKRRGKKRAIIAIVRMILIDMTLCPVLEQHKKKNLIYKEKISADIFKGRNGNLRFCL